MSEKSRSQCRYILVYDTYSLVSGTNNVHYLVFLISCSAILFLVGMDFRDFFIFLIRFALANFVLLYQLTCSKGSIDTSSSEMSQRLLFNLNNIKCITLKMKSEDGWQNCGTATIDLLETIEDRTFIEFCSTLDRTYSMICNLSEINLNQSENLLKHDQLLVVYPFDSHIRNPDNLITFLDHALKLVGTEG